MLTIDPNGGRIGNIGFVNIFERNLDGGLTIGGFVVDSRGVDFQLSGFVFECLVPDDLVSKRVLSIGDSFESKHHDQ